MMLHKHRQMHPQNTPLSILFISRKHPPSVGGMQRLSYQLVTHMRARATVQTITCGGSQLALPLFLVAAFLRGLFLARRVQVIHAGDPLVTPVALALARLYRLPVVVTVHGLDITFNFPGYQALVPPLVRRCDHVICISAGTHADAIARGIAPERCSIIYPGLDAPAEAPSREVARARIEALLGEPIAGRTLWLTVGRLVPRKGVAWFIEHVLPRVHEAASPGESAASQGKSEALQGKSEALPFAYLVVGDGPEMPRLRALVAELGLADRVYLLGRLSDADLVQVYAGADVFIMPNIPQPNDREGFGIVAIEAAVHGLPVIGARLEGIPDAVIEGESGVLLPPGDAGAWSAFLQRTLAEPALLDDLRGCAQAAVLERFGWDRMAEAYERVFREAMSV